MSDLVALPLRRVAHFASLPLCFELRGNLTVYDAAYVPLAESLNATLETADTRLSRAPGLHCHVAALITGHGTDRPAP